MSFLPEVPQPERFPPFVAFQRGVGFVPNLFRAQTLVPRLIEAEARIAGAVLLNDSALSRIQKERILLLVAAAQSSTYCFTAHWNILRSLGIDEHDLTRVSVNPARCGLPALDCALLDFSIELSQSPTWIGREEIERLRRTGADDAQILEAVLVTGLADFLCTLSLGLGVCPDFEPQPVPQAASGDGVPRRRRAHAQSHHDGNGPYLRSIERSPADFPAFAFFQEHFGFVPNIFRAQTLKPEAVEAEAEVVRTVLLTEDLLTRRQKEFILLVVSAANLNTYCVTVHCDMLRGLGVAEERSDQIAVDHRLAGLPAADVSLLDFALKLTQRPGEYSGEDIGRLRAAGFRDEQILEAVVMTALTDFLNTVQMGVGPTLDFPALRSFPIAPPTRSGRLRHPRMNPGTPHEDPRSAGDAPGDDPDSVCVERVRGGDVEAFGELVRRHGGRVYRTVLGITGSREDAEDGMQEAFLRAFQALRGFEGASRFSTWLTRIAINEGLKRVRDRAAEEHPAGLLEDDEIRPRRLGRWVDDPEQLYSRSETREMVEREVLALPPKYRLAVMLRDIEQVSTPEAAASLGIGVPTLKTRLLRGRLMLREALSERFARRGGTDT